ncbi:MAG: hypothetical protein K0R63_561 [Rickettsiales bacterium]|jgi:putative membrane protein|nr:hypothetical protein [Rickettsiales bacterium]
MSIKPVTLLTSIVVTLLLSSVAYGALRMDISDEEFVNKASLSNLFEIESSQVALQRSEDEDVREFADRMIKDHTELKKSMKSALDGAKLRSDLMLTALDKPYRKKIDKLREVADKNFDKEYISLQEDEHEKAIKLYERYGEKGKTQVLRTFATNTLPLLREHDAHAESLGD